MNILITVTNLAEINGGVCTHVIDLCKGLKEKGHSVWVISAGGLYVEKLIELGVVHFGAPFQGIQKHPLRFIKTLSLIKRIVKKHSIDIIHTHGQSQVLICQILRKTQKVPFLWTNHIDAIAQPSLFKKIYKASPFPIISVSSDLKEQIVKEFNVADSDISVVLNGVAFENYRNLTNNEINEARKKLNLYENEYVISLVGRITAVKGHQLLLEAMSNIVKAYPNIKFKLLFPGALVTDEQMQYVQENEIYAKEHGLDIDFCGFQNVRDVFGVTHLGVLPSYNEGFPLVCAEGFAMHCPYIRSDTPGSTDMKDVCLVFPKGNVNELEERIRYILDHPNETEKMVERAYDFAKKELTKERMVEKTLVAYEKVINRR